MVRATTPLQRPGLAAACEPCLLLASPEGQARETAGTHTNPVSEGFVDTFADPAVIKGRGGYSAHRPEGGCRG